MKTPTKFVTPLTEEEVKRLEEIHRHSENTRMRTRALAVLMSSRMFSVDEIARAFSVHRDTVSGWIDDWNHSQWDGLSDAPRPGGPPLFDEQEQKRIIEVLKEHPTQPKKVRAIIAEELGKELTSDMLRRIAKAAGFT